MAEYVKNTWANNDPTKPVNAARLGHLETQFDRALETVVERIGDPTSDIGAELNTAIAGYVDVGINAANIPDQIAEAIANDETVAQAAADAVDVAVAGASLSYTLVESATQQSPAVAQPTVTVEAGTVVYEAGKFGQALGPGGVLRLTNSEEAKTALSGALSMTLEAWVMIPFAQRSGFSGFFGMASAVIAVNASGGLQFSPFNVSGTAVVADGLWHHLAFTVEFNASRLSWTNLKVYLDGVLDISIPTPSTAATANWTNYFLVAGYISGANNKFARVDEFRASKGIRYPSAFTPPTEPLTVDSNTLMLFHLDGNTAPDFTPGGTGYPPRPNVPGGRVEYIGQTQPTTALARDRWYVA